MLSLLATIPSKVLVLKALGSSMWALCGDRRLYPLLSR